MDRMNHRQLPERNPQTHAQHRVEVFWQILLPMLVGILLLLAAVAAIVFSALQPVTELSRWAGVSLIWLILPSLFFALILLVILVGVGYGITMLLRITPRYARVIQLYFEVAKNKASQVTDLLTAPIIRIHTTMAAIHWIRKWRRPPANEQG